MKKRDIKVGGLYSNGKGKLRKVIAMGSEYKLHENQSCWDNLQYKVVRDGTNGNKSVGGKKNCTVESFAKWSKEEIENLVELICKRDYEMDGVVHFQKGVTYWGDFKKDSVRDGVNTFEVNDKTGKKASFHSGSDYFNVK